MLVPMGRPRIRQRLPFGPRLEAAVSSFHGQSGGSMVRGPWKR